jgi:phage protein D
MSIADLGFSLNALAAESSARQPRASVSINGIDVKWIDWETDTNNYYMADTFRVTLPIQTLPFNLSANYFSGAPEVIVEIKAGFPPFPDVFSSVGLDTIIVGQTDDITFEPDKGLITLSGRDLTARFIDTKTTDKFQNLTSSQVVTQLAKKHKLTPVVTKTTIKTGKYYEIDHVKMTNAQTEWNLLTTLANEENFDVFVSGYNLYFQPKPDETEVPYLINYNEPFLNTGAPTANFIDIKFSRSYTLAKDIIVKVISWNSKQKKGFTKTARATHNKNTVLKGAAQPTGEAQTYTYTRPNLSPEQALQKAQSLLKKLSTQEMRCEITMPGNMELTAQSLIKVLGTNTNWDQLYYADSIIRSMSFDSGFTMRVTCKNHSPVSIDTT